MASQIDFVIAAGIFITFTAALVIILLNYLINYFNISSISDLRTVAYDTFYAVFSSGGIPFNWENSSFAPAKLGLVTNLYEVPFVINETSGATRTNFTINITYSFDPGCQNKAWNSTIRVYDYSGNLIPANLYNTTFCAGQYVKKSDVVFNLTLVANSMADFNLFYSSQQKIIPNPLAYPYPSVQNYNVSFYPEMTLKTVSVDKLLALRNLSYDQIAQILSPNYKYYFEVGK